MDISVAVIEIETEEVDSKFNDALREIEGEKSFLCYNMGQTRNKEDTTFKPVELDIVLSSSVDQDRSLMPEIM